MNPLLTPEALQARILYRDADILIIDKPAGLPVHAGPRTAGDLEALLPALQLDGREVPRLAHRLDTDTSGCLVLARHAKALTRLGRAFSGRDVRKTYWAVVEGGPEADLGRIDLPLKKVSYKSGWKIVADAKGQTAVTDFRVLGRGHGFAWLEMTPATGRTHQLRVHAREAGWPMVGDPFYGSGKTAGPRAAPDGAAHCVAAARRQSDGGQRRSAAAGPYAGPAGRLRVNGIGR